MSIQSVLLTASVCSLLSFGAAVPDVLARSSSNSSGLSGPAGPTAASDPTVSVLPPYNDAYANWKNAGLLSVGGIPKSDDSLCHRGPERSNPAGQE